MEMELYDFAAGKIIAREAGAYIVDFEGNNEKMITTVLLLLQIQKLIETIF